MRDMKTVKSLRDSGLLIKDVTQTTENEPKEQQDGFLGMVLSVQLCGLNHQLWSLLCLLAYFPISLQKVCASLFGNMLASKGVIRLGGGVHRAGQDF